MFKVICASQDSLNNKLDDKNIKSVSHPVLARKRPGIYKDHYDETICVTVEFYKTVEKILPQKNKHFIGYPYLYPNSKDLVKFP
jgi:hypothetical protein